MAADYSSMYNTDLTSIMDLLGFKGYTDNSEDIESKFSVKGG